MDHTAVDRMRFDSPGFHVHNCVGVSALRIPNLQQKEAVALKADALLLGKPKCENPSVLSDTLGPNRL